MRNEQRLRRLEKGGAQGVITHLHRKPGEVEEKGGATSAFVEGEEIRRRDFAGDEAFWDAVAKAEERLGGLLQRIPWRYQDI